MKTNKLLLLGIIGLFLVSCGDDDVQKIPPATNIAQTEIKIEDSVRRPYCMKDFCDCNLHGVDDG